MINTRVKKTRVGVFIDGSNLFWSVLDMKRKNPSTAWSLDFSKLKQYLKDQYSPEFYNFYTPVNTNPTSTKYAIGAKNQEKFLRRLEGMGYKVIRKPLKYQVDGTTKGDMDVDISVDVHNSLDDIDTIILFSGDSDFLPLINDCRNRGKFIRIYSFKMHLAWELKMFAINNTRCNYRFIDDLREELEYFNPKVTPVVKADVDKSPTQGAWQYNTQSLR